MIRCNVRNGTLFVLVTALAVVPMAGVHAAELTVDWYTIDGGGAQNMTGGKFELSGTLGQFDARNDPMTGGDYTMTGGFWVIPECPAIPADFDGDCDVDQGDFAIFQDCASGPLIPHGPTCAAEDLDLDGDVDQEDFATFQRCHTGENNPGDPNCAD